MNSSAVNQRERYDEEWNEWKAEAAAFAGVRRYDKISSVVQQLGAGNILDIGCGDGRLARAIRAKNLHAVIHGCDLSTTALARSEGLDRQYAVDLNYGGLPESDESFDLLLASEVVEHLIQPDRVLAEFSRVLRQEGQVVRTIGLRQRFIRLRRIHFTLLSDTLLIVGRKP